MGKKSKARKEENEDLTLLLVPKGDICLITTTQLNTI